MAPEPQPDRLSTDEVALVLRRAAELDVTTRPGAEEGLTTAAVESAAVEAGLPMAAVRQAVAELRSGLLVDGGPARSRATTLVEAGVVPYPPDEALAMVGRWLQAQTFTRHRRSPGTQTWRLRDDVLAKLQRAFDWSATLRLKDVHQVTVRAVQLEDGTLVRVEAELTGGVAAAPGIGAGAGAVTGSCLGALGSVVASAGTPTLLAVGAATAGTGAVGGWWAGRRIRRRRSDHVADELSAHLERVSQRDADAPGLVERFRSRPRHHR